MNNLNGRIKMLELLRQHQVVIETLDPAIPYDDETGLELSDGYELGPDGWVDTRGSDHEGNGQQNGQKDGNGE